MANVWAVLARRWIRRLFPHFTRFYAIVCVSRCNNAFSNISKRLSVCHLIHIFTLSHFTFLCLFCLPCLTIWTQYISINWLTTAIKNAVNRVFKKYLKLFCNSCRPTDSYKTTGSVLSKLFMPQFQVPHRSSSDLRPTQTLELEFLKGPVCLHVPQF